MPSSTLAVIGVLIASTALAAAQPAPPTQRASLLEIPEWVTSVRLVDDLRMRVDAIPAPSPAFASRQRYRPRLRVGAIVTMENDLEVGLRLASASSVGKDIGGDPLSTNQTFEDNASRKPVGIDWAFVRWTPLHVASATGSLAIGKLENPPNFTEDAFDVDYTPEGTAEVLAVKLDPDHAAAFYFGQFVLDELAFSKNDPLLLVEQLHVHSTWTKAFETAITGSFLSIGHARSLTTANVPDANHGNTRDAAGALTNDYRVFVGDANVTFTVDDFPGYRGAFPIALYAEYIHNFGAGAHNIAYSFGPSLGSVSQRNGNIGKQQQGNWELSYRYQHLEGDANYEEIVGSDNGAFFRSSPPNEPPPAKFTPQLLNGLNLRGHIFRLAYAPLDSFVVDVRVWRNEAIDVARESERIVGTRVIFDMIWKF